MDTVVESCPEVVDEREVEILLEGSDPLKGTEPLGVADSSWLDETEIDL